MKACTHRVEIAVLLSCILAMFSVFGCGQSAPQVDRTKSPAARSIERVAASRISADPSSNRDEADILQQHLDTCELAYKRVSALHSLGARGGEPEYEAELRYHCVLTKERLAELNGNWEEARRECQAAMSAAKDLLAIFGKAYATDGECGSLQVKLVDASTKLADARLMLLNVEKRIAKGRGS